MSESTRGGKLRSTTFQRWAPQQRRWYADGYAEEARAERESRYPKSYYCRCDVARPRPIVLMGCVFDDKECVRCGFEILAADASAVHA